jgi:hypothetical protein
LGVKRAIVIIGVSAIALATGGATIGYSLGRFAPFYYRGVFRGGESPDFNPVQVGFGLGLTQGLIAGLIVGAIVVIAKTLSGLQRFEKSRLRLDDEVGQPPIKGCLINVASLLVGSAISLPIALIIGAVGGDYGCKTRRFYDEKAIIAPVLAGDPSTSSINIEMYTGDGTAMLYGEVVTKEDLDRLRSRMTTLFGEPRIKDLMDGVSVRKK